MTALLLVHGRHQEMRPELRDDPDAVTAYVEDKKRTWMAGLAKGLILAGLDPIPAHAAPRILAAALAAISVVVLALLVIDQLS